MRAWSNSTPLLRGTISLCLIFVALSLGASWLKSPFPLGGGSRVSAEHVTVLPARINAATEFNVLCEYGGSVKAVHVSNGSRVAQGQALVTLENNEISASAVTAAKRLEAAEFRLRALRVPSATKRAGQMEHERLASTLRARRAAQERLDSYSLDQTQQALVDAKRRVREIQALVSQGLANDDELQTVKAQEQAATRDLQAAREHLSRLKQEVDDADSQLRLAQLHPTDTGNSIAAAELEVEEAGSALAIARERERRLVVTAPKAGTIVDLPVHGGEWMPPGARLARIADLSTLLISAPVTAAIAQKVSPGDAVHVRLPMEPPLRLAAAVTTVDMMPDPVERAYLIRVRFPNPNPNLVLVGLEGAIELQHRGRP